MIYKTSAKSAQLKSNKERTKKKTYFTTKGDKIMNNKNFEKELLEKLKLLTPEEKQLFIEYMDSLIEESNKAKRKP